MQLSTLSLLCVFSVSASSNSLGNSSSNSARGAVFCSCHHFRSSSSTLAREKPATWELKTRKVSHRSQLLSLGNSQTKDFTCIYPLVNKQFAIENCPFLVDLPIKMMIFHSFLLTFTRGYNLHRKSPEKISFLFLESSLFL